MYSNRQKKGDTVSSTWTRLRNEGGKGKITWYVQRKKHVMSSRMRVSKFILSYSLPTDPSFFLVIRLITRTFLDNIDAKNAIHTCTYMYIHTSAPIRKSTNKYLPSFPNNHPPLKRKTLHPALGYLVLY